MTITTVATVPSTALLIPRVAAGAADELDTVREKALTRVSATASRSDRILVVAGSRQVARAGVLEGAEFGSLRPIGLDLEIPLHHSSPHRIDRAHHADVPTAASVAAWLLNEVEVDLPRTYVVAPPRAEFESTFLDQIQSLVAGRSDARWGVVVVADGSATRTPKAPGAYVEGATDWDDRWSAAWRDIDCEWFMSPTRTTDAEEFVIDGVGAWSLAATVVQQSPGEWISHIDAMQDPYGVMYPVGAWSVVT